MSVQGIVQSGEFSLRLLAGGGGFEPPLMDSESTVLPLDYPPAQFEL
jgi:hypothetical protein